MANYVRGEGSPYAKLMIVGEAPGRIEDETGRPFSGPAGAILDELLNDAGVSRNEVYVTNVVKFRPPMNDIKRIGELGLDLKKCQDELWEEIRAIKPHCIMPLGNTALQAVAGKTGILKWRGSCIQGIDRLTKVLGTIHPAALLHMQGEQEGGAQSYSARIYMLNDIKRAVHQATFPEYRAPYRRLEVLRSAVAVARYFELYRSEGFAGVDIEVIGSIPICVGISFVPSHGVSIPLLDVFSFQNKDGIPPHELAQMWLLVAARLSDPTLKIIGQNFKFDEDKLAHACGMHVGNFRLDLLLAHHTLYPEFPKTLAFQASIHTEEPYWKDEGKEFNWKKDDINQYLLYNAKDAAVTREIGPILVKDGREIQVPGFPAWFDTFYFGFVHRLHRFYMDMEAVGLPVNREKQKGLVKLYKAKIVEFQAELNGLAGFDINVNSPKQVAALLFNELRMPRRASVDEDSLVGLMANHAKKDQKKIRILELILLIRRLKKSISTYFAAKPDYDGRMRTTVNICGTESGRTSNQNQKPPVRPEKRGLAFQTMTKHGDVGSELREIFDATCVEPELLERDGEYEFIEIDQSQAEARVVALLGRDENTLNMFGRVDIHKLTASWVFGVNIDKVTKELRFVGKTTRHAGNYGMRKKRLMLLVNTDAKRFHIDVSISEWRAGEILKVFHAYNPAIEGVFQKDVEEALYANNMCLVNPFGRRREFMGRMDDELLREAYAQIPQSTVGDQTKRAGLQIVDALPDARKWICLEAHDALVALVPRKRREDYLSVAVPAFETPIDFSRCTLSRDSLVIPCECKIGTNYKDLHDYDITRFRNNGDLARQSA